NENANQRRQVSARRRVQPPIGKRDHRRDSIDEEKRPKVSRGERRIKIESAEGQQSLRQKVPAEQRVAAHQWRNRAVYKQDRADESTRQNQYPILRGQSRLRVFCRNRNREASLQPSRSGARGDQAGQHGPQRYGGMENSQPEDAVK